MRDKERLNIMLSEFRKHLALGEVSMGTLNQIKHIHDLVKKQVELAQELEENLEVLDSAIFRIGLTINNPNTSDDEKWEKVNEVISKAMEDAE